MSFVSTVELVILVKDWLSELGVYGEVSIELARGDVNEGVSGELVK